MPDKRISTGDAALPSFRFRTEKLHLLRVTDEAVR